MSNTTLTHTGPSNGTLCEPRPLRLTCDEFYAWRDRGVLEHKPSILLDGELLVRSVASPMRSTALCLASEAFRAVFRDGYTIRTHSPLPFSENTDPMQDLAV